MDCASRSLPMKLRKRSTFLEVRIFTNQFGMRKGLLGEWKDVLRKVIHPDQLPSHYGGDAMGIDGDPACGVRVDYSLVS